ncbi:MAG: hypothetical protein RLZZ625_369 [Pseudomonadota bacterium]
MWSRHHRRNDIETRLWGHKKKTKQTLIKLIHCRYIVSFFNPYIFKLQNLIYSIFNCH